MQQICAFIASKDARFGWASVKRDTVWALMQETLVLPNAPTRNGGDRSLEERLKSIHNHIYASEGIKQYSRVMDEIVKVLFARLHAERTGAQVGSIDVARTARELFSEAARAEATGIFEPSDQIQLSDEALAFAITQLGPEHLRAQDPKGAAFQTVLGPTLRGELGQFFTPDPVKALLVGLTLPTAGSLIGDPASGSAGLLLDAHRSVPGLKVRAVEIDASLARLARMNLYLSGIANPDVVRADALLPLATLDDVTAGRVAAAIFDFIVTNPPFGSKGKISDPIVLANLAEAAAGKKAVAPEVLFIERVVQLLKDGGRAGIVLPLGILSNTSAGYIRGFLRREGRIYATITLPPETFRPTGNSVNSALLFFEKGRTSDGRYPVFRGISSSVGYDHRGRPLPDGPDAPDILHAWAQFRERYSKDYPWMS